MARAISSTPRRADALRNQSVVLAKAVEALREKGADVSIDEIARRANVGAGTVMRSFGSKAKLIDAAIVQLLLPLVDRFREAAGKDDVENQLRMTILELAVFQRENRVLSDLLVEREMPATFALRRQLVSHVSKLVRRAQSEGIVRADVELSDIALLMSGIAYVAETAGTSSAQLQRYVTIVLDGLQGRGARTRTTKSRARAAESLMVGCKKPRS